jgi:hypothetical protein
MASLVNPFNINGNYPIAGQDNDSQGFRDNFTNIRNNFIFIKQEVEDLQSKVILKSALSGSSLDNNFLGSQVKNIQTKNQSETVYDWGEVGGATATEIQLDLALGNIHKINATGAIKINSVIKNWPSALQYSRLLLYINISSITNTLELPSTLTTDTTSLPGLRTIASSKLITFTDTGDYIFEFSSVDSGTTVFVRELTKGNPVFRDPNFYMAGIGSFSQPTLRLGWGNLFAVSAKIDNVTKSGTDTFSVRGSVTSYMNQEDGGNDPATMTQAGFTIAKSRTADPGAGVANPTETSINSGDYIGYFNGLALTPSRDGSGAKTYQQFGLIGMYASGSNTSYGLGGNIVIATKRDGGNIAAAITIDENQNVVFKGNIQVDGIQTVINSTVLTVDDKNIVVASGADPLLPSQSNSSGIIVDGVYANILYIADDAGLSSTVRDRWHSNKPFTISPTTTSSDTTTGALVVGGGVGIAGALNVGGTFGLSSTTEATSTTSAAFAVGGGIASVKNIIAGGALFANSTATSSNLSAGAFQVQGGGFIKGNLYIGGQQAGDAQGGTTQTGLYVLSGSLSANTASGAVVVKGGMGVSGNVYLSDASSANGVTISSTLQLDGTSLIRSTGNGAGRTSTVAFRSKGSAVFESNVLFGTGVPKTGIIYVDNATNVIAGNIATGGLVLGNSTAIVGMSVSGDVNLGTADSGSLYILNRENVLGTPISGTLTPYVPTLTGGNPTLGSVTALGGMNVFNDVYIGQPHSEFNISGGGVWSGSPNQVGSLSTNPYYGTPIGAASGNVYLTSGAKGLSYQSGALQIKSVTFADGSTSDGGMGVAGNAFVQGAVWAGAFAASSTYANLVAASTTESTDGGTNPNGSFVALGGAGIKKRLNVGGNVVIQSGTTAGFTAGNPTAGALILTGTGGIAAGGSIFAGSGMSTGNLLIAAGTTSSTPLQLTSGTLNTTAVAGAVEFNSGVWYMTPVAATRSVVNTSHLFVLSANSNLNGGTAPAATALYGVFGGSTTASTVVGTSGSFTAASTTTYEVEMQFIHSTAAAAGALTASTIAFSFGGSATYTFYQYNVTVLPATYTDNTTAAATPTAPLMTSWGGQAATSAAMPSSTSGIIQASNSQSNRTVIVRGVLSVSSGGTIIPYVTYATAPGRVVVALAGSYVKYTPITSSASTVNIGTSLT